MAGYPAGTQKYQPAFAERARVLCEEGALLEDLAREFGVSVRQIYHWRRRHTEFRDAVEDARSKADDRVEVALFKRATGYSHPAVKIVVVDHQVVEVPYTEHYPPDAASMIFWLKNRRPKEWREKHALEVSGPNGGPVQAAFVAVIPAALTMDEWNAAYGPKLAAPEPDDATGA